MFICSCVASERFDRESLTNASLQEDNDSRILRNIFLIVFFLSPGDYNNISQ